MIAATVTARTRSKRPLRPLATRLRVQRTTSSQAASPSASLREDCLIHEPQLSLAHPDPTISRSAALLSGSDHAGHPKQNPITIHADSGLLEQRTALLKEEPEHRLNRSCCSDSRQTKPTQMDTSDDYSRDVKFLVVIRRLAVELRLPSNKRTRPKPIQEPQIENIVAKVIVIKNLVL